MVNCLKIEQKSLQFFNEIHGERVVFRAKGRELAGSKKIVIYLFYSALIRSGEMFLFSKIVSNIAFFNILDLH